MKTRPSNKKIKGFYINLNKGLESSDLFAKPKRRGGQKIVQFSQDIARFNYYVYMNLKRTLKKSPVRILKFIIGNSFKKYLSEEYGIDYRFKDASSIINDFNIVKEQLYNVISIFYNLL